MTPDPTILVLRNRYVKAHDPHGARNLPLSEALSAAWEDYTHVTGYDAPTRLTTADGAYMNALFLDVDNPDHAPHPTPHDLHPHHDTTPFPPPDLSLYPPGAGIYRTRAGWRLYWPLSEPVHSSLWADFWDRYVSKHPGIDLAARDWTRLYGAPRVLRDGVPYHNTVIAPPTLSYPVPGDLTPTTAPTPSVAPDLPPMPQPTPVPDPVWDELLSLEFVGGLRAGVVLATPGSRHDTTLHVLGTLAAHLPIPIDTPAADVAHMLLSLVWESYQAMCAAHDDSVPEKLWSLAWDVAHRQTAYQGDMTALMAYVKTSTDAVRATVQDAITALTQALNLKPTEDPLQHIILYRDSGREYSVWDPKTQRYLNSVAQTLLVPTLERHCIPLQVQTRTDKGTPRSLPDLLGQYGTPFPANTVHSYSATVPTRQGRVWLMPTLEPDDTLQPRYHAEIDRYLDHAFGPNKTHVAEWLSRVPTVRDPMCALYVVGAPGTGKSLLASGIIRYWGAYTSYTQIKGNFNASLLRSPIVWEDEPAGNLGTDFADKLRALTAGAPITISQKYKTEQTLQGCPRLIITANNTNAIYLRNGLNEHDLRALEDRIMVVNTQPMAAKYLAHVGGREHINEVWVKQGAIAEHMLFLHLTAPPPPTGSRWLVRGKDHTNVSASRLMVQGAEPLALAIARTALSGNLDGPIYVRDGGIYVYPQGFLQHWRAHMPDPPDSEKRYMNALRVLKSGEIYRPTVDPTRYQRCNWKAPGAITVRAYRIPLGPLQYVLQQYDDVEGPEELISQITKADQP